MNLFNQSSLDRRGFLRRTATAGLVTGAAALTGGILKPFTAQAAAIGDADILQFALNLEYLEAEYYLYATTGAGLDTYFADQNVTGGSGKGGDTIVKSTSTIVPFTSGGLIEAYANEITQDEANHVVFLRTALKAAGVQPVAKPALDLLNSFNGLAQLAGLGESFDPFASETNFLIGSFIFEDVGVTAYRGGAGLLKDSAYISAAAGILAVEAYHAGIIRTALVGLSRQSGGAGIIDTIQKISDARDAVDSTGSDKDQGIGTSSVTNLVPTDDNSLAFARSAAQVLRIVYAGGTARKGGFYPAGMNGVIKSA